MRGTVAKRLRRQVYGEGMSRRNERLYVGGVYNRRHFNGGPAPIQADPGTKRAKYLEAKRACLNQ